MSKEELGKGRLRKSRSAERSAWGSWTAVPAEGEAGTEPGSPRETGCTGQLCAVLHQRHRALVMQESERASALRSGSGVHKQRL